MLNDFQCPYCNTTLTTEKYNQVISKIRTEEKEKVRLLKEKLESQIKEHYEQHFAKQRKDIETAKTLIEQSRKQLNADRQKMKNAVETELKQKYEKLYEKDKKEYERRLQNVKKSEIDLKQKEKKLRSSLETELKLKFDNRFQQEKQKLDKLRQETEDKEFRWKVEKQEITSAHEKRQKNLEKTIETLKQEAERRTLQEIGDISEERLLDILKKEFPEDLFERFGKGRSGGDVIQIIMNNGQQIGKILYENKNDRNWKNKWIEKIKLDRIAIGTTYAILVTKAFPRDAKHFGIIKGIPVVSPRLLPHISRVIRESIRAIEKQKLSSYEKEEKISMLYTYLNSVDFKSSVQSIGDSIEKLNQIRGKERQDHEKVWTSEEHEMNNLTKHFAKVTTNIEGIIENEETVTVKKRKLKKEAV